jgi:hypothetical protein
MEPMTGTLSRFYGGGPADGDHRPIGDGVRVVFFPRLLIERDKNGELNLYEDTKFTHAYVRKGGVAFVYDGIRAIEPETLGQLSLRRVL